MTLLLSVESTSIGGTGYKDRPRLLYAIPRF